jgi:TfoX/Sxy family transcriptional regulator of competence genes
MPTKDPALVERMEDATASMPVTKRKMFGTESWFVEANAQMFAGVWGDALMVRLGEEGVGREIGSGSAMVFDPMGGRPMREYALIPSDRLADDSDLESWLHRGLEFASGLPPKKK